MQIKDHLHQLKYGKYLEDMMDELDDPSGKIVAERLGISTSLIKDFHGILNSPEIFIMFGDGRVKKAGSHGLKVEKRANLSLMV